MVSTRKNRGKKGGRLSRTMRGGGGYNIFLTDESGALTPYAHVGTGNIFGSATNMSGEKVIERINGKFVQTRQEGSKPLIINNVKAISVPPTALEDAEATQYYTADITTNGGLKNAVIARYKKKNDANRIFQSFLGNTRTIGNETGHLMRNVGDDPDQMRHNIWTKDSMQSVLPSTPRGDDDRVDFGNGYYDGYGAHGRSKNKRKSRKKKNPHKKKKGSKHVKSKKKGKTRKNMHGGGEAYYVVRRNDDVIATGHAYSRVLPSDFGLVKPHELHTPATILKKKIKNELSSWKLNPKTLLSIVLEDAGDKGYSEDSIRALENHSNWEVGSYYTGHLHQSITNGIYTIERYNQHINV